MKRKPKRLSKRDRLIKELHQWIKRAHKDLPGLTLWLRMYIGWIGGPNESGLVDV